MTRIFATLSLLAAISAAPVMAQDEAGAGTAQEDTAAGGSNIGGALDMGEEANAQAGGAPNQPKTYIKETFGDWSVQCLEVEEADDVCQMYQLLKDGNGASVAEVTIFKLQNGGRAVAGGTFIVPLETLLTQKLTVAVDGGQARRYDYSFCNPVGCYARVGFAAEDIASFKAGAAATVTLVPALAPDQKVQVSMSLSGFTAAYDAASALRQ